MFKPTNIQYLIIIVFSTAFPSVVSEGETSDGGYILQSAEADTSQVMQS